MNKFYETSTKNRTEPLYGGGGGGGGGGDIYSLNLLVRLETSGDICKQ